MDQLHGLFTAEQVKVLLHGYCIGTLCRADAQEAHYAFEDCAIHLRTRVQPRLFEQVLMRQGLPYTPVGDFSFFERTEIKDLPAYLRLIHDLEDASAFAAYH